MPAPRPLQAPARSADASTVTEPAASRCRACGASGMRVFHEQEHVPVSDAVLLDDRDEATGFPTGALRLAVCSSCGFVGNLAFDPARVSYGAGYEESQAASPRFRAFQSELAAGLASRHALTGRRVLEVGCGKGDFLVELCRTGGAVGTGYDPAHVPGRVTADGARVTFAARRFTADDVAALDPADLVVCRHTLEHVADVRELLTLLGRAGHAQYVEVPDVVRVLRETAFWDVYYEHCSYFSAGSLARLADRCGLAVTRLERVFDGQYLALETRPGRAPLPAGTDDVADVVAAATAFAASFAATVEGWRSRLGGVVAAGGEVVLWGASSKAVGFLTAVALGGPGSPAVRRLVDVDARKAGRHLPGSPAQVVAPDALRAAPPDLVVVMNPAYLAEITADLRARGVRADVAAL